MVWSPTTPTRLTPWACDNSPFARGTDWFRGPPAKMTPTYWTPRLTAIATSSARVIPQNFTSGATALTGNGRHVMHRRLRIVGRRQTRSHQNGIRAQRRDALHVVDVRHPALRHRDDARGNHRQQPLAGVRIDHQRFEIPIVDADDFGAGIEGPPQLV